MLLISSKIYPLLSSPQGQPTQHLITLDYLHLPVLSLISQCIVLYITVLLFSTILVYIDSRDIGHPRSQDTWLLVIVHPDTHIYTLTYILTDSHKHTQRQSNARSQLIKSCDTAVLQCVRVQRSNRYTDT